MLAQVAKTVNHFTQSIVVSACLSVYGPRDITASKTQSWVGGLSSLSDVSWSLLKTCLSLHMLRAGIVFGGICLCVSLNKISKTTGQKST